MSEEHIIEDQVARATAWLAEKWTGDKNCPICQRSDWAITGTLYSQPYRAPTLNDRVFPVFHAVCTNCGYLHSFNAALAKVNDPVVDLNSGEVANG